MRLKEDSDSWKSRSIKRRDYRRDPGTPDSEVPRFNQKKRGRKHVKGCKHNYMHFSRRTAYGERTWIRWTSRCRYCDKKVWGFAVNSRPNPSAPVWRPYLDMETLPEDYLEGTHWVIQHSET